MAGEMKILGWIGGTTDYKEIKTPQISYTPVEIRAGIDILFNKSLSRELICFSKHVDTILQTLDTFNATITANIIDDAAGTIASKSYGGGWMLNNVAVVEHQRPFSTIALKYSKQVASVFEFNLPTNLTITTEDGICTFAYDGVTLETIDSGTGVTTSGLSVEILGGVTQGNLHTRRQIYEIGEFGSIDVSIASYFDIMHFTIDMILNIILDGKVVETLTVNTNDFPELLETVYGYTEITKTYPSTEFVTTNYEPYDIIRSTSSINKTLRWDTSETGHIKLIFFDQIIRDWTVA